MKLDFSNNLHWSFGILSIDGELIIEVPGGESEYKLEVNYLNVSSKGKISIKVNSPNEKSKFYLVLAQN